MSCCGGKNNGISIWDPASQQFKCSDCGTPTSNDPSYAGTTNKYYNGYTPTEKKCECGGETAKTTHANWCPKWVKY